MQLTARQLRLLELALILATACYENINENVIEDDEDRSLNDAAVIDGSRILSAYTTRKWERIWIITEAADDQGNRLATTILKPEEY